MNLPIFVLKIGHVNELYFVYFGPHVEAKLGFLGDRVHPVFGLVLHLEIVIFPSKIPVDICSNFEE